MENTLQETNLTAKALFDKDGVKKKFQELLGKRAASFMTSVLQVVASNDMLKKADANSIFHAAAVAATLNLPINNNLGFAYIVPYNTKIKGTNGQPDQWKTVAQFQLGYKGFIQLAQRSGKFKTLSACPVYEGQLIESNPLLGFRFDFTAKKSETVIGYAAYFQLLNGFEKTLYMTVDELKRHGVRYSQTFKKDFGLWKDNFDAMATKTVLKLLLSKFAPLSIEMEKAVTTDQAVINDVEATDVTYTDNEPIAIDKSLERIELLIDEATTLEHLDNIHADVPDELMDKWLEKKAILSNVNPAPEIFTNVEVEPTKKKKVT